MAEGSTGRVPRSRALTTLWQGAAPAPWRVSQAVGSCLSRSVHPDDVQVAEVHTFLVKPGVAGASTKTQVGASALGCRGRLLQGGSCLALPFMQGQKQGQSDGTPGGDHSSSGRVLGWAKGAGRAGRQCPAVGLLLDFSPANRTFRKIQSACSFVLT